MCTCLLISLTGCGTSVTVCTLGVFACKVKVQAGAEETDACLHKWAEHAYVERAGRGVLGNGRGEKDLKIDR